MGGFRDVEVLHDNYNNHFQVSMRNEGKLVL